MLAARKQRGHNRLVEVAEQQPGGFENFPSGTVSGVCSGREHRPNRVSAY